MVAVITEVCLYFEYKLYRGNRTTKINAEHFISPNYPAMVESGVHLNMRRELFLARNKGKKLEVHKALDNNVVIIKMFPGISEAVLSAILVYQV
jgi:L-asparaginase